jgi:hypothetical protein
MQTACSTSRAGIGGDEADVEVDASAQGASTGVDARDGAGWRFPVGQPQVPVSQAAEAGSRQPEPVDAQVDSQAAPTTSLDGDAGIEADPVATDAAIRVDASTAAIDAGGTSGPVDMPACEGAAVFDTCWYLTDPGVTCRAHCAPHGGYDARGDSIVGTPLQGGTGEGCATILAALDVTTVVYPATRYDYRGLGCHRWSNGVSYWITAPNLALFSQDSVSVSAELACACNR